MKVQSPFVAAMTAAAAFAFITSVGAAKMSDEGPLVEAEPVLHVPTVNYRQEWVQLGIYAVLADNPADGAKKIHTVYTARKNVEARLETGAFPEGAVIVKETWEAKTEPMTTGTVSFENTLEGRFVMVRDPDGKLGTGPRFGDGWGWAFFPGDNTAMTNTTDYKTACLGCHAPARKTDFLHEQGYPILRKP